MQLILVKSLDNRIRPTLDTTKAFFSRFPKHNETVTAVVAAVFIGLNLIIFLFTLMSKDVGIL
ncbi:hypothetical protein [uncultured Psychrosphaera sp.]|uniref:hypothetical protein n=1 Tax=uncultured Psychrosphaera sp. TaxID=1403522 RepID=UPI0030FC1652